MKQSLAYEYNAESEKRIHHAHCSIAAELQGCVDMMA